MTRRVHWQPAPGMCSLGTVIEEGKREAEFWISPTKLPATEWTKHKLFLNETLVFEGKLYDCQNEVENWVEIIEK